MSPSDRLLCRRASKLTPHDRLRPVCKASIRILSRIDPVSLLEKEFRLRPHVKMKRSDNRHL